MSLRDEATTLINRHGYPVIHCKLADDRACGCTSDAGEPDPGCRLCKGLGLLYDKRIIKTMNRFTFDEQQRTFFGEMTDSERLFYFPYDSEPTDRDLILVIDLTANNKIIQPLKIIARYNIIATRRFVGPDGLLCYWSIKAREGNAG